MERREDKQIGLDEPLTQREMFDYFERIVETMSDKYTSSIKGAMRTMTIQTAVWVLVILAYALFK